MVQKLEEVAAIFYCQLKADIIVSPDREQAVLRRMVQGDRFQIVLNDYVS